MSVGFSIILVCMNFFQICKQQTTTTHEPNGLGGFYAEPQPGPLEEKKNSELGVFDLKNWCRIQRVPFFDLSLPQSMQSLRPCGCLSKKKKGGKEEERKKRGGSRRVDKAPFFESLVIFFFLPWID